MTGALNVDQKFGSSSVKATNDYHLCRFFDRTSRLAQSCRKVPPITQVIPCSVESKIRPLCQSMKFHGFMPDGNFDDRHGPRKQRRSNRSFDPTRNAESTGVGSVTLNVTRQVSLPHGFHDLIRRAFPLLTARVRVPTVR